MALSGVGFLSKVVTNVRKWADEPTTSTKFTDAEILEHIRIAWMDVLTEVNRLSTGKTRARFDISVVADQAEYVLPPTIHQFLMFEKINSESGRPEWEVVPNHPLTPSGPGYTIEGPILRLDPVWKEAETMRVTFIPNGEAPLFEATASTWDTTNGDDLTIPASVTDGSVDSRENAYVGYILRVLSASDGSANYQQERLITGYNRATRVLTFAPALNPIPASGTVVFEVVPANSYRYEHAIALYAARRMCLLTGRDRKANMLNTEYGAVLRSLRLNEASKESRIGIKMKRQVRNRRGSMGAWA